MKAPENTAPVMYPVTIPLDAQRGANVRVLELFRDELLRYAPTAWTRAEAEWNRRSKGIIGSAGGSARLEPTDRMGGFTIEQFLANGWTEKSLVQEGYAKFVVDDSPSE